MPDTILKGMTWGHSRGITPLLAFSQRFSELHPGVSIQWHKRTLQQFADFPIEKLAEDYDLLIVDHPWAGCAAATNCVLPLDEYLSETYLQGQADHSVGHSHPSYAYGGHQWALAIDTATPVASCRQDLLEANFLPVPQTWDEMILLAKDGKVAVPAIPIDLLMNFYMFCIAHGTIPFQTGDEIINRETGLAALSTMQELYGLVDRQMYDCNPIAVAELMSSTNNYWYCPFAYGYSNYARNGYAKHLLRYTDLVSFRGQKLVSTLGGTGISVSAFSQHPDIALRFAASIVSGEIQSSLYVQHGGQPGHKAAWLDETANNLTHNFFTSTLPALERAFMRPRYNGYLRFQDAAGDPLHAYLMTGGNPESVLEEMNRIYIGSFRDLPDKEMSATNASGGL